MRPALIRALRGVLTQRGQRLIGVIMVFKMTFVESIPQEEIRGFCQRWKVRELAVFGSALRADFRPDSDVDVLVSFHNSTHWGLFDHVQMRLELEAIFQRKVDLVTRRAVEQSQNTLLREHILNTARTILADNEAVYAEG
jgi:predicted nucleotidyltransferase